MEPERLSPNVSPPSIKINSKNFRILCLTKSIQPIWCILNWMNTVFFYKWIPELFNRESLSFQIWSDHDIPHKCKLVDIFLAGTVKDDDVRRYPPFGILEPQIRYNHLGQRLLPRRFGETGGSQGNRRNQFNSRAKNGFQYWYKEPKSNISREYMQHCIQLSLISLESSTLELEEDNSWLKHSMI